MKVLENALISDDSSHLGEVYSFELGESESQMRITDKALDSVVYIGGLIDDDPIPENFVINGTAFLIFDNESKGVDWERGFNIVTAKHVIRDLKGLPPAIRINTQENKAEIVPIPQ